MDRIFNLDAQLLFDALITAVNVFILFVLGTYLLYNPVRNMMKKRQDAIEANIQAAEKDKADAALLKAEYDSKIASAEKDADEILTQARKKAIRREEDIVAEANAEAGRIIERAGVEAQLEKQKAADDMKKEMIAIATAMAGKVVSASIDTNVQESLLEETLKEMGDSTWQD